MEAQRATQLFKQADSLFLDGRYEEALAALNELNAAYPNQKNILWPAALCLKKLNRRDEALRICNILIAQFNDTRALELKSRIELHLRATDSLPEVAPDYLTGPIQLDAIDALIDRPSAISAKAQTAATPDYKRWGLIGGGVLIVLLLLLAPILASNHQGTPSGNSESTSATQPLGDRLSPDTASHESIGQANQSAAQSFSGEASNLPAKTMTVIFALSIFLAQTLAMYCTFSILGKLKGDTFSDAAADVLLYSLIFTGLSFVPLLGFIAMLVIMSKHYELACGELLICNIVIGVLTFGFVVVGIILVVAMAGTAVAVAT